MEDPHGDDESEGDIRDCPAAGLSIFLVLSAMMSVSLYMGRSDALEMSRKMGETVSGFARDASEQLLRVQRQVAFYTKKNRLLVQAVLSVGAIIFFQKSLSGFFGLRIYTGGKKNTKETTPMGNIETRHSE